MIDEQHVPEPVALLGRVAPPSGAVLARTRQELQTHLVTRPSGVRRLVPRQVRGSAAPALAAAATVALVVTLSFALLGGGGRAVQPAGAPSATPTAGPNRPTSFTSAKATYTYMAQQVENLGLADWQDSGFWFVQRYTPHMAGEEEDAPEIDAGTYSADAYWNFGVGIIRWNQLWSLPTDPAALEERFRRAYGDSLRPDQLEGSILAGANELLGESAAPPALRAALFRMLAGFDGLQVGETRDLVGRPGVYVEGTVDGRVVRYVYAVDQGMLMSRGSGEWTTVYLRAGPSDTYGTAPAATLLPIPAVPCAGAPAALRTGTGLCGPAPSSSGFVTPPPPTDPTPTP